MNIQETIIINELTYTIDRQEDYNVLKSTEKNKYGYNITMRIPNKGDKDAFRKKIENFFKREIF